MPMSVQAHLHSKENLKAFGGVVPGDAPLQAGAEKLTPSDTCMLQQQAQPDACMPQQQAQPKARMPQQQTQLEGLLHQTSHTFYL